MCSSPLFFFLATLGKELNQGEYYGKSIKLIK